jgi:hypothetical protein
VGNPTSFLWFGTKNVIITKHDKKNQDFMWSLTLGLNAYKKSFKAFEHSQNVHASQTG